MTVHIRKELWKSVNIKYFRETRCLVDYNDTSVREPAVSFFYYLKNKLTFCIKCGLFDYCKFGGYSYRHLQSSLIKHRFLSFDMTQLLVR